MRPKRHAGATDYEQLVADLVDRLRQTLRIPDGRMHGRRRSLWPGASGYPHQIDIAVDATDRLSLIECKHWGNKISTSPVLTHAARVLDIGDAKRPRLVEGIIATAVGWTDNAELLARHFGLWLSRVTSATDFAVRYRDHLAVSGVASPTAIGPFTVKVSTHTAAPNAASE